MVGRCPLDVHWAREHAMREEGEQRGRVLKSGEETNQQSVHDATRTIVVMQWMEGGREIKIAKQLAMYCDRHSFSLPACAILSLFVF